MCASPRAQLQRCYGGKRSAATTDSGLLHIRSGHGRRHRPKLRNLINELMDGMIIPYQVDTVPELDWWALRRDDAGSGRHQHELRRAPMAAAELKPVATSGDLVAIARRLGQAFGKRAAETDETDTFVADNYEALKASGLVEAGVPKELGGGGHSVDELAAMLRELAHHCSSTALAFSMHTQDRKSVV